jgi:hypothetical protein
MKNVIAIHNADSDRIIQLTIGSGGKLNDMNFVQGLDCEHDLPLEPNESLTTYAVKHSHPDEDWSDIVSKAISGWAWEYNYLDTLCWNWFKLQNKSGFVEQATAFGLSTMAADKCWNDYDDNCNLPYSNYFARLVNVVELMEESYDESEYNVEYDCIRIVREGYNQAIYITYDEDSSKLVVNYHHDDSVKDWECNYGELFKSMWDVFITNNPIINYRTITEYHKQLYDGICYVIDLHCKLFYPAKTQK